MCSQQHFYAVQMLQVVVVDGHQAAFMKPFHLLSIVNDIAQTIENRRRTSLLCPSTFVLLAEFLFCLLDGCGHSKAETAAIVDFNLNHCGINDFTKPRMSLI